MSVREGEWAAFCVLEHITAQGAYLNLALLDVFSEQNLQAAARSMATAMVRMTMEHLIAVDFALASITDLQRCGRAVKNILRLGATRLLYMDAEDAATVNAAVEMCKRAGKSAQTGYVNGVLRSLATGKQAIPWPKREDDAMQYLSIRYSWPLWAVKQAVKQLGFDDAQAMLAERAQDFVTLRVNRLKASADRIKDALQKAGAQAEISPFDPFMLRVRDTGDLTRLGDYQNGLFSLQSEASLLAVRQIPTDVHRVMDMCAAPGGKSLALAEQMPKADILAFDIHPHRVALMEKQRKRLGIDNVRCFVQDATKLMEEYVQSADAVLVDAPCSGLGTVRKRPDVKQNRSFDDVLSLCGMQKSILHTSSQYVKPGGTLVYCTCTFIRQENRDVIEEFLHRHMDFTLVPLNLPQGLIDNKQGGMMQLWPHIHGTDGFFMAGMRRFG